MANILYGDLGSERMIYAEEDTNANVVKAIYSNTERLSAGFIACSATHGIWFRSEMYNARGAGYISGEYAELPSFPPDKLCELEYCNITEFESQSHTGSIKIGTYEELPLTELAASVILTRIITAFEKKTTVCIAMNSFNGSETEYLNAGLMLCKKIISVLPKNIQPYVSYMVGGLYPFNQVLNVSIVVMPQRYKELMRTSGKQTFISSVIDTSMTMYDGFISDYAKYMAGIIFGKEPDDGVNTLNECVLKDKRKLPWENFSMRLYELLFNFKSAIEKDNVSPRVIERQVNALSGEKQIDIVRLKQLYPQITEYQDSLEKNKRKKARASLNAELQKLLSEAKEKFDYADKLKKQDLKEIIFDVNQINIMTDNLKLVDTADILNRTIDCKEILKKTYTDHPTEEEISSIRDIVNEIKYWIDETDKLHDEIAYFIELQKKIYNDIENQRLIKEKNTKISGVKKIISECKEKQINYSSESDKAIQTNDITFLLNILKDYTTLFEKIQDAKKELTELDEDELCTEAEIIKQEVEKKIKEINAYISNHSVRPKDKTDDLTIQTLNKYCVSVENGLKWLKMFRDNVQTGGNNFNNQELISINDLLSDIKSSVIFERNWFESNRFFGSIPEKSYDVLSEYFLKCEACNYLKSYDCIYKYIINGSILVFLNEISRVINDTTVGSNYYIECEWKEDNKLTVFDISARVFIHIACIAIMYMTSRTVDNTERIIEIRKRDNFVMKYFENVEYDGIELLDIIKQSEECRKTFTVMCIKLASYLSLLDYTEVQTDNLVERISFNGKESFTYPYYRLKIPEKVCSLPEVYLGGKIDAEKLQCLCAPDFINCPKLAESLLNKKRRR